MDKKKREKTLRNDHDFEGHLLSSVTLMDSSFIRPGVGLKSVRILSFRYQHGTKASAKQQREKKTFATLFIQQQQIIKNRTTN